MYAMLVHLSCERWYFHPGESTIHVYFTRSYSTQFALTKYYTKLANLLIKKRSHTWHFFSLNTQQKLHLPKSVAPDFPPSIPVSDGPPPTSPPPPPPSPLSAFTLPPAPSPPPPLAVTTLALVGVVLVVVLLLMLMLVMLVDFLGELAACVKGSTQTYRGN